MHNICLRYHNDWQSLRQENDVSYSIQGRVHRVAWLCRCADVQLLDMVIPLSQSTHSHSGQYLNGYSKPFSQSLNIQSLNIVIFEYCNL
jgi:hypothetical protein